MNKKYKQAVIENHTAVKNTIHERRAKYTCNPTNSNGWLSSKISKPWNTSGT